MIVRTILLSENLLTIVIGIVQHSEHHRLHCYTLSVELKEGWLLGRLGKGLDVSTVRYLQSQKVMLAYNNGHFTAHNSCVVSI